MNVAKKRMIRRVVASSLIGSTIEWYDFFLYGVVAGIVFSQLYFPTGDPVISTMLAFGTFAAGFVARPLGGIVFGHFGDKIGRKSMLVLTLTIMGVSTTLMAFLPPYEKIGIAAPIILLIMRLVQGLAVGGEWGGAVLMTYEHAPESKRGLYASLPQIGLSIGLLFASGVVGILSFILSSEQFMNWGWRIAFGISALLVFIGLWIRLNVEESPEFQEIKNDNAESAIPFKEMWRGNTQNVLAGMGARYIDGVFFNIMGVFSITYLTQNMDVSRNVALLGVSTAAFVMCFFIPLFGYISDRIGRTRTYWYGSLITGFSAIPAFMLMSTSGASNTLIWLSIIIPFGIFYAAVYGPEAALFSELFDPHVRYTGISFVYQFSGIFASGLTPMIATYLLSLNKGFPTMLVGYVVFAGIVSALSVKWIGSIKGSKQKQIDRLNAKVTQL
ncbi:MFS transporter [Virgibacillus dakarensis]|uniref:Putative proline/betaine transporter n=1 Tax=Lentibacillus populi TaxID=1827502 RepID=A0A9W5TZV8_9BACI|nr:MFS transporter [Lentibacillus populi]MBT2218528.1 MHS family MFS transporter [Virgibacillus dakarensis]MTW86259.1 MFS transporter [Virgibacillus dakarensis]GGB52970.1 MFS transporter [Lentibacillus populi]